MSARAVISTATIDRVGDVLVPTGCQTENYEKNPVVLWAHGLEAIGQPIGTSRGPDGQLDVTISDIDVQATCWFSQSSLEAAQIFELVDEGIVRATSVRETPIKTRMRHDSVLGDLLIVDEWDLEEWSWCAVGMNPDAVAKTISRNRLGGRPIVPSILKSLTAIAPKRLRHGIGLPARISTQKNVRNAPMALGESDFDTSPSEGTECTSPSSRPYGSTSLGSVNALLGSACRHIRETMEPLENPDVKERLQATHDLLRQEMQGLQELHNDTYPSESELKDDDESDDSEESMKAYLVSDPIASSHLLGLSGQLRELTLAQNLVSSQRRILKSVSDRFASLIDQSSAQREDVRMIRLQRSIEELSDLITRLKRPSRDRP